MSGGNKKNVHRTPIRQTALALIGELGSESNAHGVARIVRSRDSRRRMVWSLMVLFGVGAAVSQLSSLLHKYFQYQVVEVSEIQDGLPVEFPSVTLCNIEPISWRKLRQLLNGTDSNSSDVRGWLEFLETYDFGAQTPHLRSIRAFHENVGEDAMFVRHSLNESLLHCSFNKQPCSTANFSTSFDGNYYSCFTFNTRGEEQQEPEPDPDPEADSLGGSSSSSSSSSSRKKKRRRRKRLIVHSTGPEHGLSVVMFLDNNFPPLGSYGVYTLDTNILHSAGARVMVHAPDTLPLPVQHGQDVAPGFSTSVAIKPLLHARLPRPYGNCSGTQLRGFDNFTSTYSTCIAVCKQEVIVRRCGCRSSALPHLPALRHVPYCGQVPGWRDMLRHTPAHPRAQHLPRLQCEGREMLRLKNDRGYETDCGCTHPCLELSYHMSTSMSYWPTELYQFDALTRLYEDAIENSPLIRAYRLHDSNIKDGEEMLRQISRSQQGQPPAPSAPRNATTPGPADGSVRASAGSGTTPPSSDGSSRSPDFEDYVNRTVDNSSAAEGNSSGKDPPGGAQSETNPESQQQQQPLLEYNNKQLDNLREASTEIRQNLLRLNVYLEDLSVVKYKQMPAYGLEDLFADIGGTLGLWMGVSVLTIMEILELVVRLANLFLRAEWKPGAADPADEENAANSAKDWEFRDTEPCAQDHPQHGHTVDAATREGQCADSGDKEVDTYISKSRHTGYSYRNAADFGRADLLQAEQHGLFEMNGRSSQSAEPHGDVPQNNTGFSGRTKYWRLKRGKSKR
ncbi:FMRFamide-activated amiloride-sensitive sodium channel-like [Babylonia areolata]|uniref:FMRFamide-activated amiloride-sensitive sodium channel-like n=1 Tax=Babylonia areolata TaxID=304850 RepID=UPI003FD07893